MELIYVNNRINGSEQVADDTDSANLPDAVWCGFSKEGYTGITAM